MRNNDLQKDLEKLLERHAVVDVLAGLSKIMQQPGGDSTLLVRIGKIVEDLTAQELWD